MLPKVTTDANGEAIILETFTREIRLFPADDSAFGKMVVIENPQTSEVVDCAVIQPKKDEVPLTLIIIVVLAVVTAILLCLVYYSYMSHLSLVAAVGVGSEPTPPKNI